MTKVDVISGFLGAGKTTLIQKLIKDVFSGQKVVLVENEFGEIGIDGGFLKEAGIVINEVNGGCICCTLQGDFQAALKKVVTEYHPDRIVIEPSGVGKLSDILRIVKSVDGLELNSYSAVVDAKRCKIYHKNFKEFFDDQIETASCVILSKTQMTDEAVLQADLDIIHELNKDTRVITTPWNDLNGKAVFEAMEGSSDGFPEGLGDLEEDDDDDDHDEHEEQEHHHDHGHEEEEANEGLSAGNHIHLGGEDEHEHQHHHHHHEGELDADDVFDSIGIETINHYTKADIEKALAGLGDNIVRAKGIVPSDNGRWLFFDFVPGDTDIREGAPAYTGLITVIGEHVDIALMKKLFQVK
jgi:G3E family GTPase